MRFRPLVVDVGAFQPDLLADAVRQFPEFLIEALDYVLFQAIHPYVLRPLPVLGGFREINLRPPGNSIDVVSGMTRSGVFAALAEEALLALLLHTDPADFLAVQTALILRKH